MFQHPKKFLVVRVSRNKRVSAQFRAKRTRSIIEFAKLYCIVFIGFSSKRYVYIFSANIRANSR